MSSGRAVVAAVGILVVAAAADEVRRHGADDERVAAPRAGFRIDLESARSGTSVPIASMIRAFPDAAPERIAVSQVAVAPDDVVAVGLSYVPGNRASRAAIELWDGRRLLRAFRVPVGSFSRGMWFAGDGALVATIGLDGSGRVYTRAGADVDGQPYFAYETP